MELHTVVEGLPTEGTGDMVPVVLPTMDVGMVPNGVEDIAVVDGVIAVEPRAMDVDTVPGTVDGAGTVGIVMEGGGRTAGGGGAGIVEPEKSDMNGVAGCADSVRNGAIPLLVVDAEEAAGAAGIVGAPVTGGIGPVVPPIADMEVTGTAGVPGVICPVGVEQVTTVPGVVGSDASGSGANVVSGAPGWVVAENGLGPLSGEVTIVPGVDESPMAVVPMVETCARLALQSNRRAAAMNSKRRIAIGSSAPI
jgi:hypothetical protein